MRTLTLIAMAVSALVLAPIALAQSAPTVLNFDSFPDSFILTNQISGFNFANTIVLTSGISLNEFEFPPRSGANVISDNGAPITLVLSQSVQRFSGYFTYSTPVTVTAFDATGHAVGAAVSRFANNEALSGVSGSSPNELITVTSLGGISSVTLVGLAGGTSFTADDLTLNVSVPGSVPALTPGALLVLGVVLAGIGAFLARPRAQSGIEPV